MLHDKNNSVFMFTEMSQASYQTSVVFDNQCGFCFVLVDYFVPHIYQNFSMEMK